MNDRVVCVMSVGAGKYRKQYELVRDNLMAYAKKCHADFRFIDDYIDKDKKRDIYSQKLLIPDYLREYEQVLFLDLDIIISPDCPDMRQRMVWSAISTGACYCSVRALLPTCSGITTCR